MPATPYLKLRDTIILPYGSGEAKGEVRANVYDLGLNRLNILIADRFAKDTLERMDGEWNDIMAHVVSLKDTDWIDSSGYNSIKKVAGHLRGKFPGQQNPFVFIEAVPELMELVKMVKVDRYIPFYRDMEQLKELYPAFPEMMLQPVPAR